MHKFLRSIGFSEELNRNALNELLEEIQASADETNVIQTNDGSSRIQTYTNVGRGIGISVCGELDEYDEIDRDFYFPYLRGTYVSTQAPCQVQRHAEKESFAGICEEYRVGVSLIFYLQNGLEYLKRVNDPYRGNMISSVMLAGMSTEGKILLPVKKTEKQREMIKVATAQRCILMEAARRGDAAAMDSLAMDDMNMYTSISDRLQQEDIYSIVDSSFMPFGVECDQYSALGEITEVSETVNTWTDEHVYILTTECSDLTFQVAINKKDLLGEPKVGYRFKGPVWLQGQVNFEDL